MKEYKVHLENNKATSAKSFDRSAERNLVKVRRDGKRNLLDWIVVFGYDEQDAVRTADDIVKDYWTPVAS